ncbi:hypothetical protein GC106_6870 [Kibdelosporangium sp. 4NS15]|uniref:Uncharacterized protein n=1 Tax=Kibdelosporangium persicum TaxID=2698649 RepID=A0ABX2EWR4_9PSEU|nr:hypothetical protein [Kibdelosporangium persicum]NRN63486.1 hypothetical protein [Kibdelosporangium persicum]
MSAKRFRRVDRHTAGQQGLDGVPDRARGALGELLADASAPARPGELAGEEAAVAAFRTARLAETGRPRRSSMHGLTKLATVKVAAAAIGAMAVGGVAFAAATGNLPSQGGSTGPATTSTTTGPAVTGVPTGPAATGYSTTDHSTTGATMSTAARSEQPAQGESTVNPKPGNGTSDHGATPAPSLRELCELSGSGPVGEQGKRLDSPVFGDLVSAAGGKDNVPAYCGNLFGEPGKSAEQQLPVQPQLPTGQPKPAEQQKPIEPQQSNAPKPGEQNQDEPRQGEPRPDRPAPTQGRADDLPTGKPDTGPPPSVRPKN